jgi:CheY-like chemotaxis protein
MLKALHRASLGACRMTVSAARVRVLLVEPDADNRDLYTVGLKAAGFDVVAVDDVTSATVDLVTEVPAIAVTATRSAEPSTVAFLRRCSEAGIPAIALTTAPLAEHEALRAAGARFVLLKPYLPDQLAALIDGVLGGSLP